MGMDHERLHIETSAVLISQLPIDMVKKIDGWNLAPRTYGEIKGVLHLLPQKAPKLACFVLHLKMINIFLKNDKCIL